MIGIKKVSVVPLVENEGKIIDSFNTADNKHTNAPSLNAVEGKISEVQAEMTDYKLKGDFAVISGSVTVTASSDPGNDFAQTTKNINYPVGFNNTNCVCTSLGTTSTQNVFSYDGSEGVAFPSGGLATGNMPKSVKLSSDYIVLRLYNIGSSSPTVYYKIVLMKVEDPSENVSV